MQKLAMQELQRNTLPFRIFLLRISRAQKYEVRVCLNLENAVIVGELFQKDI